MPHTDGAPTAHFANTFNTYVSSALELGGVIAAAPRVLHKFNVIIDAGVATATYYLHIRNLTAIPANSATAITDWLFPSIPIRHNTGVPTPFDIDVSKYGIPADVGIIWYISTAQFTKTALASAGTAFALFSRPIA